MGLFNRRKIPSLIQLILLLILVVLVLTLLLNSVSTKYDQYVSSDRINMPSDLGVSLKSKGISSTCLSRDILDSNEVKMYSSRLTNKQYYLTIGIPTVARKIGNDYLMKTLNSLTTNQTVGNSKADLLIVLQLGDQDKDARTKLATEIEEKYSHLVKGGVLDIIQVYPSYYPAMDNLKQRFNDNKMRVKWRSKQVIDFSFLFCYCHGLGKYHIQLEDDVVASPYYYLKLKDFIDNYEKQKDEWFTLDASVLGYIGKVYHNFDLNEIASFYYLFFDEMPVDWLEYTWRNIKGQTARWRFRSASLFQHIGLVSSLRDKKQIAKEPYFDSQTQKFLGYNPPAKLHTDLTAEYKTQIMSAYEKGSGYFWGRCHKHSNCFVKVLFEKATSVERIVLLTGGNFARNDTIHFGSVEVGTHFSINDCVHYESMQSDTARFNRGSLDIQFSKRKTMSCFKVIIRTQKEWIFIREINIWPGT